MSRPCSPPLAAEADRPGWGFLATLGGIGGGPTFFGAILGSAFTSPTVSVVFLALAAGSILYVVTQPLNIAARRPRRDLVMGRIFLGPSAGFVTDMIATAAGT